MIHYYKYGTNTSVIASGQSKAYKRVKVIVVMLIKTGMAHSLIVYRTNTVYKELGVIVSSVPLEHVPLG